MIQSEQAMTRMVLPDHIVETNTSKVQNNTYKPATLHKKLKSKLIKPINFIPEKEFGGNLAQGKYNPKKQIATITNGNEKFVFTKTTCHPTNPWIPDKKNLDPNIILIGSYTTIKTKKPEMPITNYIFGVLEHTSLPKTDPLENDHAIAPMGSNPGTYAPVIFQPSEEFAGTGLIGNYFSSNKIATIHDPSGQNKEEYTFENVQQGGIQAPDELILIGSYTLQPPSDGMIHSHAIPMINLYGKRKLEDHVENSVQ